MQLVHRRRFPVDHYVLFDPDGLSSPERLMLEACRQAGTLALRSTGDARNFTLIQNGPCMARRNWPHVHIVCTRTRFRKGLIYLYIGVKNLLAGLRERR
jgi:hypothetical protein